MRRLQAQLPAIRYLALSKTVALRYPQLPALIEGEAIDKYLDRLEQTLPDLKSYSPNPFVPYDAVRRLESGV